MSSYQACFPERVQKARLILNAFEITFGNLTVELKEEKVCPVTKHAAGAYTKGSINAFYITFGNIT